MKTLVKTHSDLVQEGRWDIDYHLPAEKIREFPEDRVVKVSKLASVSKEKRDPSKKPEETFLYVDISSIDVETGIVASSQELTGEEAPSRARKIIRAYDVIVSTVRPTRRAVAVVPPELDNQICSTGFTVLRCKNGVNPYYLHFVLRLESTLEQFRKFSTGSSYPAILDSDVLKTLVPSASQKEQGAIAAHVRRANAERERLLRKAKVELDKAVDKSTDLLMKPKDSNTRLEAPANAKK